MGHKTDSTKMKQPVSSLSSLRSLPTLCIISLIVLYRRVISPFIPARCRFLPTCSAYGIEALKVHGFLKGSSLLLKRMSRCHPWGRSGYDPVPPLNKHK